MGPERSVAL